MTSVTFPKYGTITVSLDTVAELSTFKAIKLFDGLHAIVRCQTVANDGLGGIFTFDASSTDADNGTSVIAVTGLAVGRWIKTVRSIAGPQGPTGASGVGVVIPDANARFPSVATVKANSIPAAVRYLDTVGYFAPGDGGRASYKRVAANPNLGAGCFRSLDRFMPDGATDATNGGWWSYSIEGAARIEQFGGAADCPYANFDYTTFTASYAMPATGTYTDNLQPLYDAIRTLNVDANVSARNEVGSMIPIQFFGNIDTAKSYGFSGSIIPQYAVCLQGTNQGGDSTKTGTTFRFPPNTAGLILNFALAQPAGYTQKGAGNSRIEGIWFQGGGGTDRTKHGLRQRIPVFLRNCGFHGFAGNNIDNIGFTGVATSNPSFGLTSGSSYENVFCGAAGNWNTYILGSDVSASISYNLHHKGSRLGGLFDGGYFGNLHLGYECNDYANGKVGACTYNGRHYQLNSTSNTLGGATTPGTNDLIWEDLEAGAVSAFYPAWVSGGSYELSVPTFVSSGETEIKGYTENYYLRSVGGRLSGTMFAGRYAINTGTEPGDGEADLTNRNSRYRVTIPPSDPFFAALGSQVDIFTGGNFSQRNLLFGWTTSADPSGYSFAYQGKDVRFGVSVPGSGYPMSYVLTTSQTTATLGRTTPQPGFIVPANFALGNANGAGEARVHETFTGAISAVPTTGRATGEVLFNGTPAVGGAMMYTIVAGAKQPVGIVGATRATGLTSSSTLAQVIQALKDAGLSD